MRRRTAIAIDIAATLSWTGLSACGDGGDGAESPATTRAPSPPASATTTATVTSSTTDQEEEQPVTTPPTEGEDTITPADTPPTINPPTETSPTEAPATSGETTPERLGWLAATDLADRLGVRVEDITVRSVEEVTWPDASLGCPQKDFAYAQVLTPGIRITLDAAGAEYAYHAGDGRDPFFCLDPQQPV